MALFLYLANLKEVVMLILVDMDGVVADFDLHTSILLTNRHPEVVQHPLDQRQQFYFEDDYPEHKEKIQAITCGQGFFANLPMVPGAYQGMLRLVGLGHDVRICTAPLTKNDYCVHEKYHWVRKNMPEFQRKLIITKDKTLVRGDILIDDKPIITGSMEPLWQHVVYDRPYNRHIDGPRMDWDHMAQFIHLLDELKTPA